MRFEDFIAEMSSAYATFAEGDKGAASACFCLALDHWERVRGQHGYSGLVALLNQFVDLVEAELDVEVCVSRLNERSIVGLLPQSSKRTSEKQLTKLFKQIGAATFDVDDESLAVSITAAWTEFDHRFIDADRLLVSLVKGAERASAAGGNQLVQIRPDVSIDAANGSDRQMLGLLMEFLRKDALKVLYQPVLATNSEPAKSFQALPRLVSADGSLIPAAAFVPAAREAGVLNVLDRWMITYCASLLANEYQLLPIRLFLSQGDSLIQDSGRRDWLANLAEHNSSLSGKLALDFNIQDVLGNIKGARELFELLESLGIEVCVSQVDEHSRWDLLVDELPVDFVKMSPDFVQRLAGGDGLEATFREVSTPARERGAKIIMPMVEDASMAANLWRVGADYMQGFMIQEAQERIDLSD
ncbi:MAG: EAL domain-containing protein [Wenzhouxiangella sp.]|jgi:EAL domain-containing protein (putative c-di-GMP-specific phosphodiesterase class I)/GGDEF domain-containing protein|nr:EAL domain-containing protein [Wenzhouxiangella sp.]